jgi:hypothetical protein
MEPGEIKFGTFHANHPESYRFMPIRNVKVPFPWYDICRFEILLLSIRIKF